jgi:cytochrome c oxidase assembly factor CtaG
VGVLSASPFGLIVSMPDGRPASHQRFRNVLTVLGLLVLLAFLTPPLTNWSIEYGFVQAIQFEVFAIVVPVLLVAGAAWKRLGLSSGSPYQFDPDGALISPSKPLAADRMALARARRKGNNRAVAEMLIFVAFTIFWRSAPVVDALVRHPWLEIIEAATLILAGVVLFLDLIESPPVGPATARPYRIGMSAIAMWTVWVVAYLQAMSHDSWYTAFQHVVGRGISLSADQQLTAGFMWLLSASAFLPIVFWNLIHWLQSEEDPDEELYRLVRQDRTRGFFGTSG